MEREIKYIHENRRYFEDSPYNEDTPPLDETEERENALRANFLEELREKYDISKIYCPELKDKYLLEKVFDSSEIFTPTERKLAKKKTFDAVYIEKLSDTHEENEDAGGNLEKITNKLKKEALLIYGIRPEINPKWKNDLAEVNLKDNIKEVESFKIDPHFAVFQIQR